MHTDAEARQILRRVDVDSTKNRHRKTTFVVAVNCEGCEELKFQMCFQQFVTSYGVFYFIIMHLLNYMIHPKHGLDEGSSIFTGIEKQIHFEEVKDSIGSLRTFYHHLGRYKVLLLFIFDEGS